MRQVNIITYYRDGTYSMSFPRTGRLRVFSPSDETVAKSRARAASRDPDPNIVRVCASVWTEDDLDLSRKSPQERKLKKRSLGCFVRGKPVRRKR